jgi:hypothetical protein
MRIDQDAYNARLGQANEHGCRRAILRSPRLLFKGFWSGFWATAPFMSTYFYFGEKACEARMVV